jgi:hypothetical protein
MDVTRLRALGRDVATREDEVLASAEGDESLRQRLARRAADRPLRARARTRQRAGIAALAVASAAAAVVLRIAAASRPLTFTVGEPGARGVLQEWMSARSGAELPVRFSDGTRITLEPTARGRVVSLAPHGAEFVIESGRAAVSVVPNERGDFRIRTGPFVVHVHGTRFTVAWDPTRDAFSLALYEGHVTISGCGFGAGRAVGPGETLRASCADPVVSVSKIAPVHLEDLPTVTPSAVPAPAPEPAVPATRQQRAVTEPAKPHESWIELARAGFYERAYTTASADGFSEELATRGASDVLLLGDVARHAGHVPEARSAYETVRDRFRGSDAAANAAFALGRLAFDTSHDFGGAARWLEAYLAERPSGPFSAAALGRLLQARLELGQTAEARSVASRYIALQPNGPLANEARKVLGPGE